jgi:anhydro-N-acetylmuramic acid kinase
VNGKLAAAGAVVEELKRKVLGADYFSKAPPKSTDGPAMIRLFAEARDEMSGVHSREDLLRTACAIAAEAILEAVRKFHPLPDEMIVSGGGTMNRTLMGSLSGEIPVKRMDEFGIASAAKEAVAFALLGAATLDGFAGNVPAATGARRRVVLGAITPRP